MNTFLLFSTFISMTLLGSYGCLLLKLASGRGLTAGILLRSLHFYLGGLCYFLSAVLNIVLLKYMAYAIILPLTSITYVWSMIFARCLLHEKITKEKVYGMALIMIGVSLLLLK